jgi:hypothetical protein
MRATVMMLALLSVAPIAVDGQTCDYDTSKCADTGADCCASDTWGEPQTCTDGYVAVPSSGGCQSTWDQCATYESGIGCYACYPPGCSSGCSGDDDKCSSYGDDCCACDSSIGMTGCGFDEPATCTDGYVARPNGDGSDCMYSCYPPGCSDDGWVGCTLDDLGTLDSSSRFTDIGTTDSASCSNTAGWANWANYEPACASCDDDPNQSVLTYGNLHVYRFSVDHDFTIYASTCSDSTDFDSNIALFDINGNLMQQNDDTGDACGECTADAQHAGWEQAEIYCKDDFLSAGTYILVVGGAESSSGTYGITVQIDPPGGECEATCYGQTCDFWGDDCSSYEDDYGCDCSGCMSEQTTSP